MRFLTLYNESRVEERNEGDVDREDGGAAARKQGDSLIGFILACYGDHGCRMAMS